MDFSLLVYGDQGWGDEMLRGALMTMAVAVSSYGFGIVVGTVFASFKLSRFMVLRVVADVEAAPLPPPAGMATTEPSAQLAAAPAPAPPVDDDRPMLERVQGAFAGSLRDLRVSLEGGEHASTEAVLCMSLRRCLSGCMRTA